MKIREMRVVPVALTDPPLRSAFGLHAPYALRTIVQLVTDEGITGLGETYGGAIPARDLEAARERVVGQDPYQLTRIEAAIAGEPGAGLDGARPWEGALSSPVQTFSAIEVACYDIIGKATGRPVADLLGGRYRDAVPFSAYLFYKHAGSGAPTASGRPRPPPGNATTTWRARRSTPRGSSGRRGSSSTASASRASS